MIRWFTLIVITVFLATGCKEIYKPDIISSPVSYLVVEGVLNAGNGPTNIRLTRTFRLEDSAQLRGVNNAIVAVEEKDNNMSTPLFLSGDGVYTSANLGLEYGKEYRLRITSGGKEYLSEYVKARKTPVIDSLGFRETEDGVQVHVSTHDPADDTWYYKWEFDETWEIRTYYHSEFKYVNGVVVDRTPAEYVSVCWKYDYSKNILVGSTVPFAKDIMYRAPLIMIPRGDEKLNIRYSMLARQYAIDKAGFAFYEQMKKNTEGLGSIFDPQPNELRGNIKCVTDPTEPVIGYITASSVEEKRFFINRNQLSQWNYYQDCPSDKIKNHPDSIALAYASGLMIYSGEYGSNGLVPDAYHMSFPTCVDCTERGGFLQKPAYW